MTAQIQDTFLFKGDRYFLIGIQGGNLISPEQFGMEPVILNTACYRGFYATYELNEKGLFLKELTLREKNGKYLPIQGVKPVKGDYQASYYGLNVAVTYTGKIRLAKDLIKEFYTHLGFQKAIAYKTVLDVSLKNGRIVEFKDRSKDVEQKRSTFMLLKDHVPSWNIIQEINKAFSLDMDL